MGRLDEVAKKPEDFRTRLAATEKAAWDLAGVLDEPKPDAKRATELYDVHREVLRVLPRGASRRKRLARLFAPPLRTSEVSARSPAAARPRGNGVGERRRGTAEPSNGARHRNNGRDRCSGAWHRSTRFRRPVAVETGLQLRDPRSRAASGRRARRAAARGIDALGGAAAGGAASLRSRTDGGCGAAPSRCIQRASRSRGGARAPHVGHGRAPRAPGAAARRPPASERAHARRSGSSAPCGVCGPRQQELREERQVVPVHAELLVRAGARSGACARPRAPAPDPALSQQRAERALDLVVLRRASRGRGCSSGSRAATSALTVSG